MYRYKFDGMYANGSDLSNQYSGSLSQTTVSAEIIFPSYCDYRCQSDLVICTVWTSPAVSRDLQLNTVEYNLIATTMIRALNYKLPRYKLLYISKRDE